MAARLARQATTSPNTTASSAGSQASPADFKHLIARFNTNLRKWGDYKTFVRTRADSLDEALRSAPNSAIDNNLKNSKLTGAVDEFEDLISNICAARVSNISIGCTTDSSHDGPVLENSETISQAQVHDNNGMELVKPDMVRLRVNEGDVKIEELEQVITTYQVRAVACLNIGLKSLAESIRQPGSATDLDDEHMEKADEQPVNTSTNSRDTVEHALSEYGDQMQVILERARLLSTHLLYGTWNAACEILECCEDYAGINRITRPDLQLIKGELAYVLQGADDLQRFSILTLVNWMLR